MVVGCAFLVEWARLGKKSMGNLFRFILTVVDFGWLRWEYESRGDGRGKLRSSESC